MEDRPIRGARRHSGASHENSASKAATPIRAKGHPMSINKDAAADAFSRNVRTGESSIEAFERISAGRAGSVSHSLPESRDYLLEAGRILRGETMLIAQREHLEAMHDVLARAVGQLAAIFQDHLSQLHGLPTSIYNDIASDARKVL
jgi:hypothetical protein